MLRSLGALGLMAVLITGCGADIFKAPQPTAGDFTDIVGALVRRGVTVTTQVAGDPGCAGTSAGNALHSNAVRYDVRPAGDAQSYPLYVFGWKSEATYDADKATFDECLQSVVNAADQPATSTEHLPWRAYGLNWPPGLGNDVDAALTEAGGIPAPVQPE